MVEKGQKRYEIIAKMKKDILHMQNKFDRYESFLGKELTNFEVLKERHKLMEAEAMRVIDNMEKTKAQVFDYLKALKTKLRNFGAKPKAKPKPTPKKNGNGKKLCDICKKEFASSGYPSHRKKCERIKELNDQLAKELEEEPEPQIEGET